MNALLILISIEKTIGYDVSWDDVVSCHNEAWHLKFPRFTKHTERGRLRMVPIGCVNPAPWLLLVHKFRPPMIHFLAELCEHYVTLPIYFVKNIFYFSQPPRSGDSREWPSFMSVCWFCHSRQTASMRLVSIFALSGVLERWEIAWSSPCLSRNLLPSHCNQIAPRCMCG